MKNSFTNLFIKCILVSILIVVSINFALAQEKTNPDTTLAGTIKSLVTNAENSKKLKISGYIQTQWQKADTIGSPAKYSGGDFKNCNNRFQVRKGRLKFEYNNDLSKYLLLFDANESKVAIKEAYVSLTDRWLKMFSITGGVFVRPFGNELAFSSASLEPAERARISQALFPNEDDLGAQLSIVAPETSPLSFIKLQGGLFTGNGINTETDKYKDFIGQVILKKTFIDVLTLSGGASFYNGGFAAVTPSGTINALTSSGKTAYAYVNEWKNGAFVKDSVVGGAKLKRQYIGLDLQASLKSALGTTILRGEYIWGTQPGTSTINYSFSNDQPVPSAATYVTTAVKDTFGNVYTVTTSKVKTPADLQYYSRSFSGGYVTFVQSILQTKHQIVLKYDWYDPNTKVSGNEIGAGSTYDAKTKVLTNPTGTGVGDIKYHTIGLGWLYDWNAYIRFTVYYEMVKNETTNAIGLNQSLGTTGITALNKDQKDNVWTFRIQCKF